MPVSLALVIALVPALVIALVIDSLPLKSFCRNFFQPASACGFLGP